MKLFRKIILLLLALTGFGLMKLPLENKLTSQLKEQGLLDTPLDIKTKEKIGQTSGVVALGGLRSLVASMLNLRAHVFFEDQQWYDLKDTMNVVTTLQPRSSYYWENGGWHLAYNASVDFKNRSDLPEARRRILWREFIHAGSDFLEKGSRLNPDNWRLRTQLARLWSDPYKIVDIPKAAAYLKDIKHAEGILPYYPRQYFYLLSRIPGREQEAYAEGKQLYEENEKNRLPTLKCLLFVLQNKLQIPESESYSFDELFPSAEKAVFDLENFLYRRDEFPTDGAEEKLKKLKSLLGE